MYIRSVLENFFTSQIRSTENSLNLARILSFPNSIEEQEKQKEEGEGFKVSNQIFVDYSSIKYEFFTPGIPLPKRSFQDNFHELQILMCLL